MESNISHGLLAEDFNNSITKYVAEHQLDIQSKTVIIELLFLKLKNLSKQQTEKELLEYQESLKEEKLEEEN